MFTPTNTDHRASSYELFQDEVAKMEKSQDEDEDFPLPPDEDPDMKELPSESCCDPVCLRKILNGASHHSKQFKSEKFYEKKLE